jgi:hypothetical protein
MSFKDVVDQSLIGKLQRSTFRHLRLIDFVNIFGSSYYCPSPATMEITELRMLTGEEQKGLCKIAVQAASKQLGINPGDTRCFIADQIVTPVTERRRLQEDMLYKVSGVAKLNFDSSIPPALANPTRVNEIMTIASKTASDRVVLGAVPRTEAPSVSPSMAPSILSAPSTETAAPTRAPVAPLGLVRC